MPPVLGPWSAVEDALVVLRRGERDRALAVAQREQRQLLPLEELLQHDLGLAEAPLVEVHVEGRARLALVGRDDHALARGEDVRLQDGRVRGAGEVGGGLLAVAEEDVRRGRHPAPLHQLLGVGLRALQPGRGSGRPEGGDARGRQVVDQARHQRRLRPHHDEVDLALARDRDGVVVEALDPVGGDPGVAGRRQDLGVLGTAPKRAHERVLAPAAADDQDPLRHRYSAAMNSSMGIADSVS